MVNRGAGKNLELMMDKKGIFFTSLAVIVITLFVLSYAFFFQVQERTSIQKRVSTMNSFLLSTEEDLSRQLYISGFRYLIIAEGEITQTNSYLSNLNQTFQEAFFNGTFNGNQQAIMVGATYSDIISNLNQKAAELSVNVIIANPAVEITQDDSWNVKFIFTASLVMNDKNNLASWNKNETIISYVPISNFQDPMYYISTSGQIVQNISKTPYTNFVSGSDASNLSAHLQNSYYLASASAPSFIYRLEGINSPSPYGIESLVNLQRLSQQGISVQSKSVVDYIYFSQSNPVSCEVTNPGLPVWFNLDNAHLATYNASCS